MIPRRQFMAIEGWMILWPCLTVLENSPALTLLRQVRR